jgi:hypothetical protein
MPGKRFYMFYVKQDFGYAEVITEIHDDNVFTHCPDCGIEHQVDIAAVFVDGEIDLYGTGVFCKECSKKHLGRAY